MSDANVLTIKVVDDPSNNAPLSQQEKDRARQRTPTAEDYSRSIQDRPMPKADDQARMRQQAEMAKQAKPSTDGQTISPQSRPTPKADDIERMQQALDIPNLLQNVIGGKFDLSKLLGNIGNLPMAGSGTTGASAAGGGFGSAARAASAAASPSAGGLGAARAAGAGAGAAAAGGGAAGAGAAAGAAGGIGAAAAVAGPIGLAMLAADKAADGLKERLDMARDAVAALGDTARKVANDDLGGILSDNVDRASKAIEQIPIYGKIYAAEMQLAAAPFREVKATLDAFIARGRDLSGYDGRMAAAYAQADVMKLQGDIKEAQTMGAQYAELAMKQAEADRAIRDALLPIKMQIADLMVTVMPTVVEVLQSIALVLAETSNAGEGVLRSYPGLGFLLDKAKELDRMKKDLQQMKQDDPFEAWLQDVKDLPLNEPPNAQDMGQFKREIAGPLR